MSKFLRFWLPVIVWMTIIFLLSSRQRISVSEEYGINFVFFKSLHLIEYALLFLLSFRALSYASPANKKRAGVSAFVIVLLYAISDELHQTFVPSREGTARDVIIDCFGASLSWIFLTNIIPRLPKKLKQLGKSWQLF